MLRSATTVIAGTERILTALRQSMAAAAIDALLIPSEDLHQSEYRADCHKRREFLTGFSGSAGTALVTATEALLWTDGRYFDQAERELSSSWHLMRQGNPDVLTIQQWLSKNLNSSSVLAVDPTVTSLATYRQLQDLKIASVYETHPNLVDVIWGAERPPMPSAPVSILPLKFAGVPAETKIEQVRERLRSQDAGCFVVCALDEVAWLLNLRGRDIAYNPVFFAFAVVPVDGPVELYIDSAKLAPEVLTYVNEIGVRILPYDAIFNELRTRSDQVAWLDPNQSSMAVFLALDRCRIKESPSPIEQLKAIKNNAELEGMRHCHIRDGAALVRFLTWLDREMAGAQRTRTLNENEVAKRLEAYRSEMSDFQGLSFTTISGSGPNGAIIHYDPSSGAGRDLSTEEMYLVDSGGQYLDGTTDVTRTVHFGTPTKHEIDCFTRVLIGHIRLAKAVFPGGTSGHQLDVLARDALWSVGLNYNHGTGHGVGSFLCVHEGPHGISALLRRMAVATNALKPGMTVTNEPGYYESGKFGIRIENVMLVQSTETKHNFGSAGWMCFETVTLAPIQKKLIDVSLLSPSEVDWLNAYHALCLAKLSPILSDLDQDALRWLQDACSPLSY